MTVNISYFAGAGWQFFDNSGYPLTGGLIYSYEAGTTTPLTTYTTSAGNVAHSNPIVLDAAGRVNEIWLTDSTNAKFVVKTSAGALIATYDNIPPLANQGEFANFISDLANTSNAAKGDALVGFKQSDYAGSYPNAVGLTVHTKLQDFVSVKDFGAVGDYDENAGTGTDDTAAFQAAIDAVAAHARNSGYNKGSIYIPWGAYKITSALNIPAGISMFGEGGTASVLWCANCDCLNFTGYGVDANSVFFQDFGIFSATGSNYAAIVIQSNTNTMDGIYFQRLRLQHWDTCFYLAADWNCTIENCVMQNVNIGISLSGANGVTIGCRILNNRMVRAAGGNGVNGPYGIVINNTTQFTESIHIWHNQIYGFAENIRILQALFVDIVGNDLSGSGHVINFLTTAGGYNIAYNYIEVGAGGIGIYGAAQNVEVPYQRCVIQSNYFQGSSGTSQTGIQMDTSIGQYQWNYVIRDNTFYGLNSYDIQLWAPGKCLVDNNRCMSTGTTNSIFVGQAYGPPVTLTNNYCAKNITLDLPSDYANGDLIMVNNVQNSTLYPSKQTAAPTTGTWKLTDIVYNSAPAAGSPVGWVCITAGTPGTWLPFGQTGVLGSVSATPAFVGQIAVVAGVGYMATGVASSADWKQIT